jgi:hypothetical protein
MDKSSAITRSPLVRCLASTTNYAHRLTRALYRKGAALDTVHLETVLNPDGEPALVSVRQLCALVDLAVVETKEMFDALRIPIDTLRISKQAERARKTLEPKASL